MPRARGAGGGLGCPATAHPADGAVRVPTGAAGQGESGLLCHGVGRVSKSRALGAVHSRSGFGNESGELMEEKSFGNY